METTHKRPLAAELMAEDTGTRRWKTCLHEAGHAVAGHWLLKRRVKAAVYEADVGEAYLDIEAAVPRTFEEALSVAAGPAAEELADDMTPPQASPPAPALTVTHAEAVAPLVAQLRQSPRDAVALALWCIRGIEGEPERWAKRFYWIRREAGLFVACHRQEIVAVAAELYARGIVTLEAETVRPMPTRVLSPHRRRSLRSPMRSRRPAVPAPPAAPSPTDTADVLRR